MTPAQFKAAVAEDQRSRAHKLDSLSERNEDARRKAQEKRGAERLHKIRVAKAKRKEIAVRSGE